MPQAYEQIHAIKVWYPLAYADDEVQEFMDSCYRALAQPKFDPTWNGHERVITCMFLYRWTLDPETRRELAFNRTLSVSPASRRLTLENYLLIAGEMRIRKQSGLIAMLRQGELSPTRYRELSRRAWDKNSLLVADLPRQVRLQLVKSTPGNTRPMTLWV